jgi:hypothetical protein
VSGENGSGETTGDVGTADATADVDTTDTTAESDAGIDLGRFGRTLALIGIVTAVFMLLTANRLDGDLVQIGFVAIGTVAFITAVVGFFIAAGSAFDE